MKQEHKEKTHTIKQNNNNYIKIFRPISACNNYIKTNYRYFLFLISIFFFTLTTKSIHLKTNDILNCVSVLVFGSYLYYLFQ